MGRNKTSLKLVGALFMLFLLLFINLGAVGLKKQKPGQIELRSDVIKIDAVKIFGPLERPEVFFLHDRHTDSLEKENKTCETCHISRLNKRNSLSIKFFRNKDTNKEGLMALYHNQCIGCHREMTNKDKKTGPIEICGECHRKRDNIVPKRTPAGFDKMQHFQHVTTLKGADSDTKTCQLCHHEYDDITQALFYEKGKEGTCRYCHKDESEENRVSMRIASHTACIDCHQEKRAENLKAGHIKCGECHNPETKPSASPLKNIPRLDRGQPDLVMITAKKNKTLRQQEPIRLDPVPFDHKAHEEYNDTCRVCHHASLESCNKKCHTSIGSKEGGHIVLEQAMHNKDKKMSCIGCHEINKRDPKCASCHVLRKESRNMDTSCLACHMKPLAEERQENQVVDEIHMAKSLLESRKMNYIPFDDQDIKEKVIIKQLEEKYQPVELPHRQMVYALFDGIKDNRLAGYFHRSKETICQGCHHNSPATQNPPPCSSCHGKPFNKNNISRPGLKGAYHQMCLGCHNELGLEKPKSTECQECHKLKS